MGKRVLRVLLIVLDAFLALTAAAGGIGLLIGENAPSLELLANSPFRDYTVPGLALLIIVGGCSLAAMVMMVQRHPSAPIASVLAGLMIIGFEIVEVLAIGSPPGIARNLQIFYFTLGLLIVALGIALWATQRRSTLKE